MHSIQQVGHCRLVNGQEGPQSLTTRERISILGCTRRGSYSAKGRVFAFYKHKLFALVNVQMALGQTAGCPRVNRAKKFMCSPRNTGNINFSLWLTGGLSQGCPNFQKVYVFKVNVPFSCPILSAFYNNPPSKNPSKNLCLY